MKLILETPSTNLVSIPTNTYVSKQLAYRTWVSQINW